MYCEKCGKKMDIDSVFCASCGEQLHRDKKTLTHNKHKPIVLSWPLYVAMVVLFITLFPWDYAFYMLGKVVICAVFVYYCIKNYDKKLFRQREYFWYFLVLAVLYNPLIPVHLFYRMLWIIVDLVVIVFLWVNRSKIIK